jgi:hypothetical protein
MWVNSGRRSGRPAFGDQPGRHVDDGKAAQLVVAPLADPSGEQHRHAAPHSVEDLFEGQHLETWSSGRAGVVTGVWCPFPCVQAFRR